MKRRSFLAATMATGALMGMGLSPARAALSTAPAAVVLTDIDAQTDPEALLGLVSSLLDKNLWVTCAIRLPQGETPDSSRDEAMSRMLQSLLEMGDGIELALDLPDLATLSPYFQSRRAYDGLAQLHRLIGETSAGWMVRTLLCDSVADPSAPIGVRASGIRNVLTRPDQAELVRSESWSNGVVRFFGGAPLRSQPQFQPPPPSAGPTEAELYYISAADLLAGPYATWASGFAQFLNQRELAGEQSLMTVSDIQLRDDYDSRRLIALVLDLPDTLSPADQQMIAEFETQLQSLNLSLCKKPAGQNFWIGKQSPLALVPVSLSCEQPGPIQIQAPTQVSDGFTLRFTPLGKAAQGMDGCAVMSLPVILLDTAFPPGVFVEQVAQNGDMVLMLTPDQLTNPASQKKVTEILRAVLQDRLSRPVDVWGLAKTLHSTEPVVVRHRLTRAARAQPHPDAPTLSQEERTRLMADARKAWAYFESFTNKATGLCPATVNLNSKEDIQLAVTMWDVGSNLNGITAAVELGLISQQDGIKRIKTILPHIAGRQTEDGLLPQGWIRVDRRRWGTRDFDACDTGRLMASLDNVRRRLGLNEELAQLVTSWDMNRVIEKGEIFSIKERERFSAYSSHCAHYTALAGRRWGLNIRSPYETFDTRAPGDGEIALLEATAAIGPLGAEPLLLEALELGMSRESAFLADTLLRAQEEEFEATGRLMNVTETPLNRPPWFIYQGLALGMGSRAWRLDTVGHQPEYMTEQAVHDYLTFSTKAAFLWAAYKPGSYSERLLSYAREKNDGEKYFLSGTDARTGEAYHGYSDLNTNGIILQAIAYRLRGDK